MLYLRRPRRSACGIAALALLGVIFPAAFPVGTETPEALRSALPVFWLAPETAQAKPSVVAEAVEDLAAGKAAQALPVLQRAADREELGGYALLYLGRAQLALDRLTDARATAARLLALQPTGYLADAARWFAADVAEAGNEWVAAVESLRALAGAKPLEPERVYLRLGQDALKANDTALAISSFTKVYYDYALSDEAADAGTELAKLSVNLVPTTPEEFGRQLERAQQFYDARRYADARTAFVALQGAASTDDRPRVDLRIAECDFYLKRYAAARDELLPLVPQAVEAEFFYIGTLRGLGRHDEYVTRARAFVEGHPAAPLGEETLNNLATHYVLTGDDEKAAQIFAELYARFPTGPHANRAAWKSGWWKYRNNDYAEAARVFESAAEAFPRDDYRPSWLYWAARAHQRLGERDAAAATFGKVIADYRNSYYGRQAIRAMTALVPGFGQVELVRRALPAMTPGDPPPTAGVIEGLLSAGLYDTAILELRKAQAEFGRSPLLDATMAYALNRKGEFYAGTVRMRRAYPQFLADGGELLPKEIRRVIFPVAYWDVISQNAVTRNLDPYLMAALVNQESSFLADVKSSAGAWGLMQIMPGTGRQIAARLHIRPYNVARLKQPEVNVKIGMANFSSLVAQYGSVAPALAAYNAGDSRVTRWLAERRDLDQDEFIDDIPFPETQNYVKRIIGTADDYRALYADLRPGQVEDAAIRRPAPSVRPAASKSGSTVKPAAKSSSKSAPKKTTTSTRRAGTRKK